MSSEQVIACAECGDKGWLPAGDGEVVCLFCNKRGRLSTPAAGGDASVLTVLQRAGDAITDAMLAIEVYEARDYVRQLQARNAEQAAQLAEVRGELDRRTSEVIVVGATALACSPAVKEMWDIAREAAEAKHTALLDGIEGSPSGVVKEVGGSLVMIGELSEPYRASAGRVYIISADDLQRLRESSVPAIGED